MYNPVATYRVQLHENFTFGVPDIHQGCEFHDLSLVDPANRRPINYTHRQRTVSELETAEPAQPINQWKNRFSGQAKFWRTHTLLTNRRTEADFWSIGDYVPLSVEGKCRDYILAFARQTGAARYVTIVPLYLARLCRETGVSYPLAIDWQDTHVALPTGITWQDCLSTKKGNSRMVGDLFANGLPLAFIKFNQ